MEINNIYIITVHDSDLEIKKLISSGELELEIDSNNYHPIEYIAFVSGHTSSNHKALSLLVKVKELILIETEKNNIKLMARASSLYNLSINENQKNHRLIDKKNINSKFKSTYKGNIISAPELIEIIDELECSPLHFSSVREDFITIENAIYKLAKTYGVEPNQIRISINSKK